MKLVIDISESDYNWIKRWAKDGTQVPVYDALARYIVNGKALSEEQEQKMGKWIKQHYICVDGKLDTFICSECRYECCYDAETGVSAEDYKYCPNCGVKMRVDK